MFQIADQIARVPLFNGLPPEQLQELAQIAIEKKCTKGESLFTEGTRAGGFYVIMEGRVKIYKLSLEGKEQILHIFGDGESFGEVPVFSGGRYPANADTLAASRLLFFPREAFVELIRKEPSLAMNMLGTLCLRLRQFTHQIENLSLREVPGRLAAYLLFLSKRSEDSDALELDITKGQLASLLGTIPETLSRILAKMSQLGHIEVDGRRIRLLDRDALESLAAGEKLVA